MPISQESCEDGSLREKRLSRTPTPPLGMTLSPRPLLPLSREVRTNGRCARRLRVAKASRGVLCGLHDAWKGEKFHHITTTPDLGYSGKGRMTWYLDLYSRLLGTGDSLEREFYSLLPAWPLRVCEFAVSGLSCPSALRVLGFKVRDDPASTEARPCFCRWAQWSREGTTVRTQSLDQGRDAWHPAWGFFHRPSLLVPD